MSGPYWRYDEDDLIRRHPDLGHKLMSALLIKRGYNRSPSSVSKRRFRMGLSKSSKPGHAARCASVAVELRPSVLAPDRDAEYVRRLKAAMVSEGLVGAVVTKGRAA